MPAQSPTLSPTLSAITAGLRGSSSGMPASIFPTRSAPTSAPLVKMPPPSRAKMEISEAPKLSPTRASMIRRGPRPFLDRRGDRAHPLVAGGRGQHAAGGGGAIAQRQNAAGEHKPIDHRNVHAIHPSLGRRPARRRRGSQNAAGTYGNRPMGAT